MSTCDLCLEVCEFIANKVIIGSSCFACELLIGAAFTAAEVAFPEADEILPEIEVVFETVFKEVCDEYGTKWIKKHSKDFAKKVCKKVNIC